MGKKKSTEPNLHVCGEDGTQRGVYKLKEEHEEKGSKKRKRYRKKKKSERREKESY